MTKDLRSADAKYDDKIAFVYVDWDDHRGSPITKRMKVPRQSTLIMLTGEGEVGRLVAQTSKAAIQGLLDMAPTRDAAAPSCSG